MKFLTKYINTQGVIYFGESEILGEAKVLFDSGQIDQASKPAYHEWIASLQKDDQGQPIKPDIGVETHQVDGELEKQIQAYIDENGQDSIGDIVFDPATMTFTIDEAAKNERVNGDALKDLRAKRDRRIAEVEPLIMRHLRQQRMNEMPSLTEAQIGEIDSYIQALADLPSNAADLMNPEWPEKPSF